MSSLLRSRKQCFYCGHWSSKTIPQAARNWQCESCQAVNYLDENGEITDPPADDVARNLRGPQRYAIPASTEVTDTSLFCRTCLKNQQILTHLLSNYLPPPEDPEFARREKQYPQYRKELEERYPQVCRDCEPRVQNRIRETGYAAKTDHLKRLMERSRQRRIANRLGWRSLVVRAAGLVHLSSLLAHFCWTSSVIISGLRIGTFENSNFEVLSLLGCLRVYAVEQQTSPVCRRIFMTLARQALLVGFISLWWNPRWQDKLQGKEGRLYGLRRYYVLQSIALSIRFAIWFVSDGFVGMESRLLWTLHVVSMPILVLLHGISLTAVRVDNTPAVSWKMDIPQLVGEQGSRPQMGSEMPSTQKLNHPSGQFPISSLYAPPESLQISQPIGASAWSEPDEMEWEPSQDFRPTSYAELYPQRAACPSPFHGRLPPAPTTQFMGRSAQELHPPKDSIGLAPGHFDKPSPSVPISQGSGGPHFLPPKFFPANDHATDTGLENIFGKVFSLGEGTVDTALPPTTPNPSSTRVSPGIQPAQEVSSMPSKTPEIHLASAFLFLVLLIVWLVLGYLDIRALQLRVIVTASIGGGAVLLLFTAAANTEKRSREVPLYLIETVAAAALTASHYRDTFAANEKLPHLVTALAAVMVGQEVILSASSSSTYIKPSASWTPSVKSDPSGSRTQQVSQNRLPVGANRTVQKQTLSSAILQSDGPSSTFTSQPPAYISRPRTESADSNTSDSDASSVASTVTSASTLTPGFRNRAMSGTIPGLGFGSLRLDDSGDGTFRTRMSMRNLRADARKVDMGLGRKFC